MIVMPCAIVALLSLYLSFLYFGLVVRTQSRSCGLCHHPYTKAHIKGFGSSYLHVYVCLLLCLMLVLASLVLGFDTLDALSECMVVFMRPCLDATTWDASLWCRLLHSYLSPFLLRVMICLLCLFVPPVGFICIFTHLLTCPSMSLAC